MKKKFLAFASLFIFVVCIGFGVTTVTTNVCGGTAADVKMTKNEVINDIKTLYSGKSNLIITEGSSKYLNTFNLKQKILNKAYNDTYGRYCNGTCTIVASTIATEFYDTYNYYGYTSSTQSLFNSILNSAIENNYYRYNAKKKTGSGTYSDKFDECIDLGLALRSTNKDAKMESFYLYQKIKQNADKGKPVGFNIPEHSMIACGYQEYQVKYTYKTLKWFKWVEKEKTETVKYVVVNDGWSMGCSFDENYSYFRSDLIGFNLFTALFNIAEFSIVEIW